MRRAQGIDISKFDKSFNYFAATQPIDFVFQRILYGNVVDALFEPLWRSIQPVSYRFGYHYFRTSIDWEEQAELFLQTVENRRYHAFALDYESAYNSLTEESLENSIYWMEYVSVESRKPVIFYTNKGVWNSYIAGSPLEARVRSFPFWIAQYPLFIDWLAPTAQPALPIGVSRWDFWQYGSDYPNSAGEKVGKLYGVERACVDVDVFNGTTQELRNWLSSNLEDFENSIEEVNKEEKEKMKVFTGSSKINVPYVSQLEAGALGKKNDCGPTCVAMLLAGYLNEIVNPDDLYALLGITSGDPLISVYQLKALLSAFGINSSYLTGLSFGQLFDILKDARPAIALFNYKPLVDAGLTERPGNFDHFAVLVGMDLENIYIHDPYWTKEGGKFVKVPIKVFEKAWYKSVVVPDHGLATFPENNTTKYTVTAVGLRIRSGAGMNYPTIGWLRFGNTVDIVEITLDGWGKLSSGGYVGMSFLKKG